MKTKSNKRKSAPKERASEEREVGSRAVFVRLSHKLFLALDDAVAKANRDPRNKWTRITRSSVLRAAVELGLPVFLKRQRGTADESPAALDPPAESPQPDQPAD